MNKTLKIFIFFTLIVHSAFCGYHIETVKRYRRFDSHSRTYFGIGSGYSKAVNESWEPKPIRKSSATSTSFLSVEGVAGYEFRRRGRIRPFIQFEVSQPAYYLKMKARKHWGPRGQVSIGIGF